MKVLALVVAVFTLSSWSMAQECQGKHAEMSGIHSQHPGPDCAADCPEKGHEVVKRTAGVTIKGEVKCNHCDLHRGDKCQKVLLTADKKVYQFCPKSVKGVDLKSLSGKQVQVSGQLIEMKDVDSIIHVEKIEPVS